MKNNHAVIICVESVFIEDLIVALYRRKHSQDSDLVQNTTGILLGKKSACQVRQDRLSNHPNYFVFHFILVHLFYGHTKKTVSRS